MKTCRTCNQTKPADAYRGTRSACRECEKAQRREWYAAQAVKPYQRPEMKAYYRQWYAAHAESVKARAVEWTKANPDKRRDVCRENTGRARGFSFILLGWAANARRRAMAIKPALPVQGDLFGAN